MSRDAPKKQLVDPIIEDVKSICESKAGINFFKKLMQTCGYQESSIVIDPQSNEVNTQSTIYHEARRNVYLSFRKMLPKSALVKIELP